MGEDGRGMRAMVAPRIGGPDVLELKDVDEPQPGSDEVVIDVVRAGINFADLLSISGRYAAAPPPPFIPGLEVSGTEAESGHAVMALVKSGGLDLTLAGGWPLVTTTAYCGLAEMARIRRGETVLVTAAAGGLGSTCVQVAKAVGAGRVGGMASTPEKREFARRQG